MADNDRYRPDRDRYRDRDDRDRGRDRSEYGFGRGEWRPSDDYARSADYGYQIGSRRYPAHTCISVNEEVVHGIPSLRRVLRDGDIVSLDVNVEHNGFIGDTAKTVPVGGCGVAAQRLLDVTEAALYEGIAQAVSGNRVVDISRAIQRHVETHGYSVVREFVGHGVGRSVHEEPQVPNFVEQGKKSPLLRPGMTIAIEPMVNAGKPAVKNRAASRQLARRAPVTALRARATSEVRRPVICGSGALVWTTERWVAARW